MVDIGVENFFKVIETELAAGIAGLSIFTKYCLDPVQRKLNKSNKYTIYCRAHGDRIEDIETLL